MASVFTRPAMLQRMNTRSERYEDWLPIHVAANKTKNGSEFLQAGAVQSKRQLTFEVRYFAALEAISYNTQLYRIVFNGVSYNITAYDDYKLQHRTVKLLGESV